MNPAIATVTLFALIVTKLVDFLRNAFDPDNKMPAWIWQLTAVTFGIVIAFVWALNALEAISHTPAQGAAGQFITGIAMGAAASGWHELLDAFSSVAKRGRRT